MSQNDGIDVENKYTQTKKVLTCSEAGFIDDTMILNGRVKYLKKKWIFDVREHMKGCQPDSPKLTCDQASFTRVHWYSDNSS